ncbi:hypothetical protein [Burkholderia sp. LMG 21824]|uniref:hypothetical protein n=1 Tax=Burkholderia sp. LMG 21824 TaxID=3158172 RepID=UPI003C2AB67A
MAMHPYQMARHIAVNGGKAKNAGAGDLTARKSAARKPSNIEVLASTRITWTELEWRAVVEKAIELQAIEPNLSDYQAADRAQAVALLTNRQRPFYSAAGNPQSRLRESLSGYFLEMRAELAAKAQEAIVAETAAVDAPAETSPAAAQEQAALELDDASPSSSEPPATLDYAKLAAEREALNAQAEQHDDRRHVVRWNDEEKLKIARKSLDLMRGFEGMKPLEAIRKAAEYELPDDRQRTIMTFGDVKWIDPLWKEIQDQEAAEALARERAEQEARQREAEEREASERAEAERIAAQVAAEREQTIDEAVNERLANISFEGIARLFARKVARTLMDEIGASLYADVEEQIEGLVKAAKASFDVPLTASTAAQIEVPLTVKRPAHKPKVLICGLLNQQIAEIKHSFGAQLDLDFAKHREEGGVKLKDKGARDLVLIMDDWGGSRFKREAKAAGIHFVSISGTVSALKKWLDAYVSSGNGVQ